MPSKKKAGSAAANGPRPQPVQPISSTPTKPAPLQSSLKSPSPSIPSTEQQARSTEQTEEAMDSAQMMADKDEGAPAINRKKQKRRQKQAAKLAEQQHLNSGRPMANGQGPNGHVPQPGRGPQKGYFTEEPDYVDGEFADDAGEVEDAFYSGEDPEAEDEPQNQPTSKKSKKKKKKKTTQLLDEVRASSMAAASLLERSALATQQPMGAPNMDRRTSQQKQRDQIWNDSKNAERENIKQFWLNLGEEERKSLVQIEKEAVLKKMKEQKSQCNCTICGRKRLAIEEELEVLYDAYYDELEHYVHPSQADPSQPRRIMPTSHSREPSQRHNHSYQPPAPPEHFDDPDDEDEYEDEYEDEEEEEDELYSEDELEEVPRVPEEFYNFSNSLRVKDGILTVAEDLLKNNGQEFINMMDKLADRRMQREEEARFPQNSLSHSHNHGIDEDDYDDDEDEDDEDYDSQDVDEEDDDMDALTEEQRMEEGRRMFQVFAARMFEQRVMTAYREKVARERQQKLIEELDEESRLDSQREAKKAREAAKKKEKKRQQKQAKEEEKARKEAEKAALEAETRAIEEKKLEEQRLRREEQRKKREAEKKAQEEERARKEAERQKKLQQDRERQAEAERKHREAKEREKKKREEARKKEREEREAKEKEVREQRLKEDRERRVKDEEARKQKEAAAAKAKLELEYAHVKRPPVAVPPGLHPQPIVAAQSPHFAVATPIVPKAPTPARPRQSSQQGQHSHGSSPRSQQATTETSQSSASPVSGIVAHTPVSSMASGKLPNQQPILHHPQPSAPLSPLSQPGRQTFPFNNYGVPGMPTHGPPPGMMPNMMPQMPMYPGPPMGGQYRNFGYPNNMPFPPGMNGARPYPQRQNNPSMPFTGQGQVQPPTSMPPNALGKEPGRRQSHSRQPSGQFPPDATQPMPISRPAPIGRPSSTAPDKQHKRRSADPDMDTLATQLGSKALLDDSDLPLSDDSANEQPKTAGIAPGSARVPSFSGFNDPMSKHDAFHLGPTTPQPSTWAFGTSPGSSTWGPSPPGVKPSLSGGWPGSVPNGPATNAFGIGGGIHRPHHASRPVAIRIMATQACRQLASSPGSPGFHPVQAVLSQVAQMKPPHEPPIQMHELLDILDTEGNHQNGGGNFTIRGEGPAAEVRFDSEDNGMGIAGGPPGRGLGMGGVGDIGSPVIGHSQMHQAPIQGAFGGIGSRF